MGATTSHALLFHSASRFCPLPPSTSIVPRPYLWQQAPRVPVTEGKQYSQPCRCKQTLRIRVQLFLLQNVVQRRAYSREKGISESQNI